LIIVELRWWELLIGYRWWLVQKGDWRGLVGVSNGGRLIVNLRELRKEALHGIIASIRQWRSWHIIVRQVRFHTHGLRERG
jgi:hypothetical protein